MDTSTLTDCPCGSHKPYTACCAAIHRGERVADTAEALMRSRYTAHVIDDLDYLSRSWHSRTRPNDIEANEDGLTWERLEILSTGAGRAGDDHGEVEFIAHFTMHGNPGTLHELSQFAREDGKWRYLDGKLQKGRPLRKAEKVGRNDPCPCGSGRKYKKCCM